MEKKMVQLKVGFNCLIALALTTACLQSTLAQADWDSLSNYYCSRNALHVLCFP